MTLVIVRAQWAGSPTHIDRPDGLDYALCGDGPCGCTGEIVDGAGLQDVTCDECRAIWSLAALRVQDITGYPQFATVT